MYIINIRHTHNINLLKRKLHSQFTNTYSLFLESKILVIRVCQKKIKNKLKY